MALNPAAPGAQIELATLGEAELLAMARAQPRPEHVAIIMDGNGRWATRRGLPRVAGHREGVKTARSIVRAADALGLHYLTLYAFSSENWSRPEDEVSTLLSLLERAIRSELPELMERNVRLRVLGRKNGVPLQVRRGIDHVVHATRDNTGLGLMMAFNYGGRAPLLDARPALPRRGAGGGAPARGHRGDGDPAGPLHRRRAGPRPPDPDERRDARVELPPVADRLHRAVDHADALAGLRRRRPLRRDRGVPAADAPVRRGVARDGDEANHTARRHRLHRPPDARSGLELPPGVPGGPARGARGPHRADRRSLPEVIAPRPRGPRRPI